MDYEKALEEMKKAIDISYGDGEVGHQIADNVLLKFLKSLGYNEIVELFDKVYKWYA